MSYERKKIINNILDEINEFNTTKKYCKINYVYCIKNGNSHFKYSINIDKLENATKEETEKLRYALKEAIFLINIFEEQLLEINNEEME